MTYVVAGITGNTGRATAEALLAGGAEVRAVVRSKDRARERAPAGVELVEADLADADALTAALAGAEGFYTLVPPDFPAEDYFASRKPVIDGILAAVARADVPRVVALSSVAADQNAGTGPIRVLRPLEAGLRDREGAALLRAAYFQENLGMVLEPAATQGVFPTFVDPERRFEMVATADIGRRAAELLTAPDAPPRVVNLAGPEDHSMREVASILGGLLGKDLDVVRQPPEAVTPILRGMGAGHLADLYAELNRGMDEGTLRFETPPPIERGTVTVRETLGSMLSGAG